jgi:hypothetical protein
MSKLFPLNDFDFSSQYGTGTLAEERPPTVQIKPKAKPDAANIIGASADGLNSITNMIGMLTGGSIPSTEAYNPPPPPPKKKVSPLLIGGIIGGVALIILLIVLNNGKPNPSPSPSQ